MTHLGAPLAKSLRDELRVIRHDRREDVVDDHPLRPLILRFEGAVEA